MRFLAAALMTLSLSVALANPLGRAMRDMDKAFKKIKQTMTDPSQNEANARLAQTIAQLLESVINEVPSTISELGAEHQGTAFAHYQGMMQQEIGLAYSLAQAFANNDNASAAAFHQQMTDLMDQGHDQYEPR